MKHTFFAEYDGIRIRPIEERDIEFLREWRNNKSLSRYLRPIDHITAKMQKEWYEEYLEDDTIITFAIEELVELKRMVGSVSVYDFKNGISNCGKILVGDSDASGKNIGFRAECLSLHVGISKLKIEKYIREVDTENEKSIRLAKKLGFTQIGERDTPWGRREYLYEMTKEEFYSTHPEIKNLSVKE